MISWNLILNHEFLILNLQVYCMLYLVFCCKIESKEPSVISRNSSAILIPQYNFSATFKLGRFLNQKHNVDMAKERVKIADADLNQKKLQVRMEVLKRYEEFEQQVEILKATSKAEDDASSTYTLITDLFKVDKATAEDYLAASTSYHTAVEKRIRANSEMNIAKLRVEEMIGISLDEARRLRR